jgi:DNA-binding winged helix-turn-helix (wHTH) protein/tetratricopeptide (TPR) repeat protein
MRYYYGEYCFDRDTFTLYYNDQPQALKTNEAKLLALFINKKADILSKDQILDEVWGEQSVSEQVVFQNISQLRSIFGRNAIKTFPKKGYQWQLPFNVQQSVQTELETSSATAVPYHIRNFYLITTLLFLTIMAATFWLFPKENLNQNQANEQLYLIPFSTTDDTVQYQLTNFNNLLGQKKLLKSNAGNVSVADTASLFNFPETTKQALNIANNHVVVSGYLSSYNEKFIVEYKLVGDKRNWSGYFIGQDARALATALKSIIASLRNSGYFNEPNSALLGAKLRLLLEQRPNSPSIIYHLLRQQLNEQNYDVAKALVEKLINLTKNQANSPYMAMALFVKGMIYHQQNDYTQALEYYNQALAQLSTGRFTEIQYKIEMALAWLAYAQQSAKEMQQHVHNSAIYAQQKDNVLAQVSVQTTGSILSHKLGDIVNRYKYLNTAKSLLITHQVPAAHNAIIHYHLALFASDKKEAESYYLAVLSLPRLVQYQWLYESAVEDLLGWYIEEKQWKKAVSLFHSQPENSFNLSQKARLLYARGDNSGAFNIAKQAFDQARLDYQHNNALHAALLLYQLQEHLSEHRSLDYQQYIVQNASKFWLNKHKDELSKLGYFDGLTN